MIWRRFSLFDGLLAARLGGWGEPKFLLGTDDQGRDMISSILYGARLSLGDRLAALTIAAVLGVGLGLAAGIMAGVSMPLSCGLRMCNWRCPRS